MRSSFDCAMFIQRNAMFILLSSQVKVEKSYKPPDVNWIFQEAEKFIFITSFTILYADVKQIEISIFCRAKRRELSVLFESAFQKVIYILAMRLVPVGHLVSTETIWRDRQRMTTSNRVGDWPWIWTTGHFTSWRKKMRRIVSLVPSKMLRISTFSSPLINTLSLYRYLHRTTTGEENWCLCINIKGRKSVSEKCWCLD